MNAPCIKPKPARKQGQKQRLNQSQNKGQKPIAVPIRGVPRVLRPLPSDPVELIARAAPTTLPEPSPVRRLATRPPFPAYEATGPLALI